jgi:DNA-binding beta-propeller fold protein YncE
MKLWAQHAIRAWPTLVFIDPQGYVLGQVSGEPDPDRLTQVVGRLVSESERLGVLERLEPFRDDPPAECCRFHFPGKIRPLGDGRWVLADAGHNQVVLLDDAGGELARFGSGAAGFDDGAAFAATFRAPQGVDADADAIWVADTGNHAIRRIDMASGAVTTVAGTGQRGRSLGDAAPARATALASPWDVLAFGGGVLFANAGTHQLGALDADGGQVERLAGTGAEALVDGAAPQAVLAQPSGLALAGGMLFFVDSETSSLRVLDLDGMQVRTLVGAGLFDFGHQNGPFAEARLQHPLGLAVLPDGDVLVADSYNHVVRVAERESGVLRDLDDGFTCLDPVCLPPGGEPSGIAVDPGAPADDPRVLLVETNRHRIMEIRPARRTVRTWAE